MRISAYVVPFFTLLFGFLGYNLRLSEHQNVFDPITGLPERGAITTYVLLAVTAIFMLAMIIFTMCAIIRNKSSQRFDLAFGTNSIIYPFLVALIGGAWAIGTFLYYSELNANNMLGIAAVIFIILSALAAISIFIFAFEIYRVTHRRTPYTLSIIPIFLMCFWLILIYRDNTSNPVLLSYAYQTVAIAFASLSFYFTACFVYGKPVPGKAIISYLFTIYFCMVMLADGHPIGVSIIILAVIAYCCVYSSMLINNLMSRKYSSEAEEAAD